MDNVGCPCCARPVHAPWTLSVTPWRMYRQWRPDGQRPSWSIPLCVECAEWLGGLVAVARGERPAPALFGSPASGTRRLVFDDQCHICFELPYGRAAKVAWIDPEGRKLEMFACDACEAWIASLASDGHTVRGRGDRQIDGPYGYWPHPNLRGITVGFDIADAATLAVVRETCAAMGMADVPSGERIRVVEAVRHGRRESAERPPAVVVLAGPRSRRELLAALESGAAAWSTIPVTPQQLTACFAAVLRAGPPPSWDPASCLAVSLPAETPRASILCHPESGVEPWDVAWLLRRFCRGYDHLAWVNDQIVLVPRAGADLIEAIAARLRPLLAGRATLEVVPAAEMPVHRRLDVAG